MIYEDGRVAFADIEHAYVNWNEITVRMQEELKNIVTIVQGSFSDGMSGFNGPIYFDIDGNMYK